MTNRFKGLDVIDRVPENLWTEVCEQANVKKVLGCSLLQFPFQENGNSSGLWMKYMESLI